MIETWYTVYIRSVSICRYSDREAAEAHAKRLREEDHLPARVVEEYGEDMFEQI